MRKIVCGGGMPGRWRIIGWNEPSYSEDKRWVPRKTGGYLGGQWGGRCYFEIVGE